MSESTPNPAPSRAVWAASLLVAVASAALVIIGLRRRPAPPASSLPANAPAPLPVTPVVETPALAPVQKTGVAAPGTMGILLASGVLFAFLGSASMERSDYLSALLWCLIAGIQWAVVLEMGGGLAQATRRGRSALERLRQVETPEMD